MGAAIVAASLTIGDVQAQDKSAPAAGPASGKGEFVMGSLLPLTGPAALFGPGMAAQFSSTGARPGDVPTHFASWCEDVSPLSMPRGRRRETLPAILAATSISGENLSPNRHHADKQCQSEVLQWTFSQDHGAGEK